MGTCLEPVQIFVGVRHLRYYSLRATLSLSIPYPPPGIDISSTHTVLPIDRLYPSTCDDSWRVPKRVKRSPRRYRLTRSGTFDATVAGSLTAEPT